MDISVIIPSYKPQEYLWECLDSLSKQSLDKSKFEIILILNGCNEPYRSQIQRWIDTHSDLNFNLLQTDVQGVSNARNIGIDNAKGEYITFIDDDDYVSVSYLEGLLKIADNKSIILSDSRAFVEGNEGFKETYSPHIAYQRCYKNKVQNIIQARAIFNGPCMKLIPISLVQGINFDTTISNGEDALFMFLISKKIKKLKYAEPSAIYYRRYRTASATTAIKPKLFWIKNAFRLNNKYLSSWIKKPFAYNFLFTCNRLMANIKGAIWHIKSDFLS